MRLIIRQILSTGNEFPTFSIEVEALALVSDVKLMIKELTRLPAYCQRLCCFTNGVKVLLNESFPINYYHLEDCSNLFLTEMNLLGEASEPSSPTVALNETLDAVFLHKVLRVSATQECRRGCLTGMQKYLAEYYNVASGMREEDEQLIDKLGSGGWGCVHYAAYFGSVEILSYLLDLGVDINKESHDGWTPLQLAVSGNHLNSTAHIGISVILASPIIEVNKMTAFRGSALHIASLKGFPAAVEMLLKSNANMVLTDYKGRIPLQLTVNQEIIEMIPKYMGVQTLRKYSKSVDFPDALDDLPEVPPPFCGELSYCDPAEPADVILYIVLDIMEADVELYATRDNFLDHRSPMETIALDDILSVQSGRSTDSLHYLIITHKAGRHKFYSKHQVVAEEWERQINYAVQLHKTKQAGLFHLRASIRLNTSFKDPEAPLSPSLRSQSCSMEFSSNSKQASFSKKRHTTLDAFDILQEIGTGSFGCVYKVRRKADGAVFALKGLNKKMLIRNKQLKYAVAECRILRQLDSPFIMKLLEAFQTPSSLYMVIEYCPGKDLSILLDRKKKMSTDEVRFYAAEILLALEYLHARNIVYRDLKPENVLLDEFGHAKLADFGLAKENVAGNSEARSFCGSPAYISPEVLNKQGAGKAADLYGLGVVLYELLSGQPPFYDEDLSVLYENIKQGKVEFPRTLNSAAKELIKALLNKNPALRPSPGEIRQHQFFRKMDWEAMAQRKVTPPLRPNLEERFVKAARLFDKDYAEGATLEECVLDFDH